jgi:hypothetical protein
MVNMMKVFQLDQHVDNKHNKGIANKPYTLDPLYHGIAWYYIKESFI